MFVDAGFEQMRHFIAVTEGFQAFSGHDPIEADVIVEVDEPSYHPIKVDLDDLCDRMRTFMEAEGGEYAYVAELTMQRAADMIENLIEKHFGDQTIG